MKPKAKLKIVCKILLTIKNSCDIYENNMPIYDFKCSKCNTIFEKIVKTSDSSVECENCNSEEVDRVLSSPRESGVVLKGEGFYKQSKSSW